jgi:hypothetical protein
VFTVLTGGYEVLNEQPAARESALPFFCFTDAPVASETWQMRPVKKLFPGDDIRSQRAYKLRAHDVLPEFDASLYIDNSVLLKLPPERIFELAPGASVALPAHSFRATLRGEFAAVIEQKLDDPALVAAQLSAYDEAFQDVLARRPLWTGMMLRDHRNPNVTAAMEMWFAHVCRYSRRDQLSCLAAFELAGLTPRVLALDNHESEFHSWPHIGSRVAEKRLWLGDAPAEVELRLEIARLNAEVRELAAAREALLRSTSWRVTAPLRGAVGVFRRK